MAQGRATQGSAREVEGPSSGPRGALIGHLAAPTLPAPLTAGLKTPTPELREGRWLYSGQWSRAGMSGLTVRPVHPRGTGPHGSTGTTSTH